MSGGALRVDGTVWVEVVRAWPRRNESVTLTLAATATVADALAASGLAPACSEVACAIFGARVGHSDRLQDGDRVDLLRSLEIDPKDARRRRARKSK